MKAYVYMIQCGEFIKIGYSASLERRIYSLSRSTPYDVSIIRLWEFDCKRMAYLVEQEVHAQLVKEGLRHKLEWYRQEVRSHAELICEQKIADLDNGVQRLKNRLNAMRPRSNKLRAISKKEKAIKQSVAAYREIPKTRECAIRSAICSFKHMKAAESCGVNHKKLWRFINKNESLSGGDLDKCQAWIESMNYKIKWSDENGAKT